VGFGQEIKDFLNASMAVRKSMREDSNSNARNNYYKALIANSQRTAGLQERRLKLAEQGQRAGLGLRSQSLRQSEQHHQDQLGIQKRRLDLYDKSIDARKKNLDPFSYPGGNPADAGARTSAVDAGDGNDQVAAVDDDDEDTVPEMTGAHVAANTDPYATDAESDDTGEVQHFAQGGAVEDAPALDDPITTNTKAAAGAIGDYTSSGDTADGASAKAGGIKAKSGFDLHEALNGWEGGKQQAPAQEGAVPADEGAASGKEAPAQAPQEKSDNPVGLGLKSIMQSYGMGQQRTALPGTDPHAEEGLKKFHAGSSAASDQEIAGMNKAVDPNNELDDSAKTVARLDAGVNYWLAQGNKKNAAVLSQRLLEYGKQKTQALGQAAAEAAKRGDTKRATELLTKAYDYIPDGGQLKTQLGENGRLKASVLDQRSGVEVPLGDLGPQELYHYSLGVANGSVYMQHLVQIASGNIGTKGQKQGGEATPRIGDRIKVADEMKTEASEQAPGADGAQAPKYALPKGQEDSVKDIASQMFAANNMNKQDALRIASGIVDPKQKDHKITLTRDGAVFNSEDGRQIKIPRGAYLQAVAIRGKMLRDKSTADEATKKKADEAKISADKDTADQKVIDEGNAKIRARVPDEVRREVRSPGREAARRAKQRYDEEDKKNSTAAVE
jgi:hypothetical protein